MAAPLEDYALIGDGTASRSLSSGDTRTTCPDLPKVLPLSVTGIKSADCDFADCTRND